MLTNLARAHANIFLKGGILDFSEIIQLSYFLTILRFHFLFIPLQSKGKSDLLKTERYWGMTAVEPWPWP